MNSDLNISALGTTTLKAAGSFGNVSNAPTGTIKSGDDFSDILLKAGNGLVNNLQAAEAKSIAGLKGEVATYEVASAVVEAEQTLRMATAIRDKIISAYLEISRMQI